MHSSSNGLWVIATPIGNIGDLSPRAKEHLRNADVILAEDTRRTGLLLSQSDIKPEKLISFHEHNERERQAEVLRLIEQGHSIALVSDAGTPLVADPGYRLVRACRKQGLPVTVIPGPSAPVAALAGAGIAPLPFSFLGFLPKNIAEKRALFTQYAALPGTTVFFERKDRLPETLILALEIFGPRELAVCRELTKLHEEYIICTLDSCMDLIKDLLGEITVIIGPPTVKERSAPEQVTQLIKAALAKGLKGRRAVAEVQSQCKGWSGSELYKLALKLKNDNQHELLTDCQDNNMDLQQTSRGLTAEFTLNLPNSLHARPAARLAQAARQFESDILLISDNGEVDAKSMLDILSLAPQCNERLKLLADGPDARAALETLAAMLTGGRE